MQVSLNYFLLAEHEAETWNIKIGHNSRVPHFVERKLGALLRDEKIKPEKAKCW
jgi:hypothetical protein